MDEARVIPLHGDGGGIREPARRTGHGTPRRPAPVRGKSEVVKLVASRVPEETGRAGRSGAVSPKPDWEHRVAAGLTFLRRRVRGQFEVDEYGFDSDLTASAVLPLLEPLYRSWFRVQVRGIDNIPAAGPALLVANHAGGLWPLDVAMTAAAVHVEHPAGRFLRTLGSEGVLRAPALGALARRTGSAPARAKDVDSLLAGGRLVGIWPEGAGGIGKPFAHRYRVQRFDRPTYVDSAIRSDAPVIPVSIVGSEEIHPVLGNAASLARVLGLPYFPLTPTFPWLGPLGLLPLPSKWLIEFGEPIPTAGLSADPAGAADLADRVRETIQANLYRLLTQRRSVWR